MGGGTTRRNVLLIAAVLGLITSLLIYQFLKQIKSAREAKQVTVVVTAQEIPQRTVIIPDMVLSRTISARELPNGQCYRNVEDVIGKVTLTKILPNTPITAESVGDRGVSLGLSFVIPPSMRAVTVAVDPVIGVAGFLKAGDHVDVVATFDRNGEVIAKTVLQDVQLLALGPQTEKERVKKDSGRPAGKDTATLLVTPAEAERLVLAENEGKLRLVLRAVGDVMRVDSKGVTSTTVTGSSGEAGAGTSIREITGRSNESRPPVVSRPPAYNGWSPYSYPTRRDYSPPRPSVTSPIQPTPIEKPGDVIEVIRGTDVEKVTVEEKK